MEPPYRRHFDSYAFFETKAVNKNLILRADVSYQPIEWITWQDAVNLYARDRVAWGVGEVEIPIVGGISRLTGLQSRIEVNSIVVVKGAPDIRKWRLAPPLTNRELFARDGHMCLYCGAQMSARWLTRDHVVPRAQGGADTFDNTVTACRPCNELKGARRPEQAKMPLLAVPFTPNRAEWLYLLNRNVLADQMEFLKAQFRKGSRIM